MDDTEPQSKESRPEPSDHDTDSRDALISELNKPLTDAPVEGLPSLRNFVSFNTRPIEEKDETENKESKGEDSDEAS
jgi:hypothetical protein